MKKIIIILLLLFPVLVSAESVVEIDFFYSPTCPHCAKEEKFLDELEDKEKIEEGLVKVQDGPEGVEVLQQPIGKTNPYYTYAPAWNVSFLKASAAKGSE